MSLWPRILIELAMWVVALILLVPVTEWRVWVGIVLLVWANNLMQETRVETRFKRFLKG